MREIKFRAWDKSRKMIIKWEQLLVEDTRRGEYLHRALTDSNYTLMQFTGFYDKNETEVYEGDVIEFPFLGGLHREIIEEHNHDGHEYCWWLSLPWNRVFTVIGNIYENPELSGRTE